MHTLLAKWFLPSVGFENVMLLCYRRVDTAYVQIEQHMTRRHCNCWVIYGNNMYTIHPKLYGNF